MIIQKIYLILAFMLVLLVYSQLYFYLKILLKLISLILNLAIGKVKLIK